MAQKDVLDAINDLRRINDDWHTSKDVIKYLKDNKKLNGSEKGIFSDLLRLSFFNLIDVRGVGIWDHHKEFRGKRLKE